MSFDELAQQQEFNEKITKFILEATNLSILSAKMDPADNKKIRSIMGAFYALLAVEIEPSNDNALKLADALIIVMKASYMIGYNANHNTKFSSLPPRGGSININLN
jgi:hypothetical protein